jgi:hypothetical protein
MPYDALRVGVHVVWEVEGVVQDALIHRVHVFVVEGGQAGRSAVRTLAGGERIERY